ncbi:transglycosylase SLT domain-containing protein [Paraliobacillus zengyii]|uniref:transglycosylase SLT domain-containing protein n=1 Tax=Paraliobacillus zengyii TaxID=2213194 RepID=UPI000DD41F60|nr:transglycosylase SLT domain-containing protein [Paraliobacillus zengyii]
MKKNKWIYRGLISVIAIIFIISFKEYQTRIDTLKQEKQQLEQKNNQLEATASYNDIKSTDVETANYKNWSELENTAENFVADSDGEFKKSWGIYLANEAKKYEIDPYIVYELLKVETGNTFDPDLVGPETKYGQAYGMSQFMKNTAPWIADMADLPYDEELLFDPYYSIQLSVVYLDFLHHEYDNWDEALTAYHRGMSGMETYKESNGTAKSDYANKIQTKAEEHKTVVLAK